MLLHFIGVDWVGVNPQNGRELLLSFAFIARVLVCVAIIRGLFGLVLHRTEHADTQTRFWMRRAVSLFTGVVLTLGLLSICFSDLTRLATAFGLQAQFGGSPIDLEPRVFYRMTDNWIELAVRFIVDPHGVRGTKDAIASATCNIVGFPPIEIRQASVPEAPDLMKKNASPNTA